MVLNPRYKYGGLITEEEIYDALKDNPFNLRRVHKQTEDICLFAVNIDGNALQYVFDQTKKICIAAVEQNFYAITMIRDLKMYNSVVNHFAPVII